MGDRSFTYRRCYAVWPSSINISPRAIGRITPWEAIRAIGCASGTAIGDAPQELEELRGLDDRAPDVVATQLKTTCVCAHTSARGDPRE
jgi:hypothetical protein